MSTYRRRISKDQSLHLHRTLFESLWIRVLPNFSRPNPERSVWKPTDHLQLKSPPTGVISWPWEMSLSCAGWGGRAGPTRRLPSMLPPHSPPARPSHHIEISARRSATRSEVCMSNVTFSEIAPPGCKMKCKNINRWSQWMLTWP